MLVQKLDVKQKSLSLDSAENYRRLKINRIIVFFITFFCYASVHATRTSYSYAGPELKDQFSENFYGWINFSFLISLGISMKILGRQGDKMNLSYFVSGGMFAASLIYLIIGLLGLAGKITRFQLILLMSFSGIAQSTCWPGLVAIMGNWFGKGSRGLLMGLWAGNSNLGNIIGYFFGYMTITVPQPSLGWPWCLIISCIFLGIMAIVQVLLLNPYPNKLGIYLPPEIPPDVKEI